ncbi:hypothetical protein [Soonwooa sp.]|uniref:hypothetical protein n=1 Tax=Soonwooa sp. TaxID=1938592 RepID=UPI0028ADAF67|nr:hypothetical protein [Soonwooa sp.]
MMRNKLFETTINKKDTCLSYVLKRTGIKTSVEFVEDLESEFDIIPIKDAEIEIGDIVAWQKKVTKVNVATTIKEPKARVSELKSEDVSTRFHLGVVEDNAIISDLTRSSNAYYIPTIRKRRLSIVVEDYQQQCPHPDYVIRKRKSIN